MALLFDQMGEAQRYVIGAIGAVKMNVTNVADYYFHHNREHWDLRDFAFPRPPFDVMWVEYKYPKDTFSKEAGRVEVKSYKEGMTPYFGCLLTRNHEFSANDDFTGIKIKLRVANNYEEFKKDPKNTKLKLTASDLPGEYGVYGGVWYIDQRTGKVTSFNMDIGFRFNIGEDGLISDTYMPNALLASKTQEKIEQEAYLLHPVLMAMSFCNCKNIEIVDVSAPPKLNKRRVERGKKPLVEYKIVNVLPFGKSYKPQSRSVQSSDGQGIALRIVPGNYARYGAKFGRGLLFGKYEGMFWRQQHTVGSREFGEIKHDYEVKAGK